MNIPRSPSFLLTASALALALGGCAVGPDYQRPEFERGLAAAFDGRSDSGAPAARVEQAWWRAFGDAALDALVEQALARSPDIEAAQARIRQARASAAMAAGGQLPQIGAAASVSRDRISRNSELMANNPLPDPQTTFTAYAAGFDASWEIDLFGRTARQVQASRARSQAAEAGARDARLQVAAEVARNVIEYRALAQRLDNANRDAAYAGELLRLAQLQRGAGLASDSDVHGAQDDQARSAAVVPALEARRHAVLAALTVMLDSDIARVRSVLAAQRPIPQVPEFVDVGVPSELLRRRADVREAERQLAAATADIGVAVADQYPRLTLVGSLGLDSIHPGQLTDAMSRAWSVGPSLALPLFSGGRLREQVKVREAGRDAALAAYRKAVLAAVADTETALVGFDRERGRLADLGRSRSALRDNVALAGQRYRAGETARIELLAAQRALAAVEDQWLQSRQARAIGLLALVKALGGGWNE